LGIGQIGTPFGWAPSQIDMGYNGTKIFRKWRIEDVNKKSWYGKKRKSVVQENV
jgi:hypothetical protein